MDRLRPSLDSAGHLARGSQVLRTQGGRDRRLVVAEREPPDRCALGWRGSRRYWISATVAHGALHLS